MNMITDGLMGKALVYNEQLVTAAKCVNKKEIEFQVDNDKKKKSKRKVDCRTYLVITTPMANAMNCIVSCEMQAAKLEQQQLRNINKKHKINENNNAYNKRITKAIATNDSRKLTDDRCTTKPSNYISHINNHKWHSIVILKPAQHFGIIVQLPMGATEWPVPIEHVKTQSIIK